MTGDRPLFRPLNYIVNIKSRDSSGRCFGQSSNVVPEPTFGFKHDIKILSKGPPSSYNYSQDLRKQLYPRQQRQEHVLLL